MLSTQSAHVVKATLPVIGGAIGEITPIFYKRMFAAHPELERDLFNRGNQAQGDQQSALAGAIAAYATLLVAEDGRDPLEVLARIAQKHASLGIAEDLYPVVHEHLFAAIVEVLGEAVTPEVASAWDEVYWHMAKALITIETGLYAESGVAFADVWRTLVLRRRLQESPDTVSFVLGTSDGSALPQARPGQYVRSRWRCPTVLTRSASTASPTPRRTASGRSRSRPSPPAAPTPARSCRPVRSRTSCTRASSRATRSGCRRRSASWSWRTPTRRWC